MSERQQRILPISASSVAQNPTIRKSKIPLKIMREKWLGIIFNPSELKI